MDSKMNPIHCTCFLLLKLDKIESGFQLSDVFVNLAGSAIAWPLFVIGKQR